MSKVKPICPDHKEGQDGKKSEFCKNKDPKHFQRMFHYCFHVDTEAGCIPNTNPDSQKLHEQKFHHTKEVCSYHLTPRGCNKNDPDVAEDVDHMKYYLHPVLDHETEHVTKHETEYKERPKTNCMYYMRGSCDKFEKRDESHMNRFAHPCKFHMKGKCTKSDDEHLATYDHPELKHDETKETKVMVVLKTREKPICKYHLSSRGCNKNDDNEHLEKFDHPELDKEQKVCWYHMNREGGCVNKTTDHLVKYSHPHIPKKKSQFCKWNEDLVRACVSSK